MEESNWMVRIGTIGATCSIGWVVFVLLVGPASAWAGKYMQFINVLLISAATVGSFLGLVTISMVAFHWWKYNNWNFIGLSLGTISIVPLIFIILFMLFSDGGIG